LLESMYPAAPETMQPTASPTMMLMFFKNGEPNISVNMMLTNDRKPIPINSADPQGRGLGANIVGHSWKMPLVGRLRQSFEPPPQFGMPDDPIKEAPIIKITVPVTIGGKIRWRTRGGINDMKISKKAQTKDVPKSIP